MQKNDLTGRRFGRLLVIAESGRDKHKNVTWLCRCSCGKEVVKTSGNLVTGHTLSCGCLASERTSIANTKHGEYGSELYMRWAAMLGRCRSANQNYGGRGISVCVDWADFSKFRRWAISNGYRKGLSIERKDVNGNYEPENCEWIAPERQQNNTRRSNWQVIDGREITLADLSRETGVPYKVLHNRIMRLGWDVKRAISEPINMRCLRGTV